MAQSKSLVVPLKVVIFHSYVNVYQRVNLHLPMFSYVFPRFSHVAGLRLSQVPEPVARPALDTTAEVEEAKWEARAAVMWDG